MKRWITLLKTEERLALAASAGAFFLNIALYLKQVSLGEAIMLTARYFTFGHPLYALTFLCIYFFIVGLGYFFLTSRSTKKNMENAFLKKPIRLMRSLLEFFRAIGFLLVAGFFFSWLLANASYQLRFSGKDLLLFRWDQILFKSSPFFWLPNVISSPFFSMLFQYAYVSLGILMIGTLALLFIVSRENFFRKAVMSFLLSLIVAFPLFYFLPCAGGPYHYFVENLRGNAFPADVAQLRAAYHPSPDSSAVSKRIADSDKDIAHDNAVPISCFPSMHAVWALFVVYFAMRVRRWSLFFTIPWLILMLISGLFFAQHYAVDYIVALPVATLSVFLANFIIKYDEEIYKIFWHRIIEVK